MIKLVEPISYYWSYVFEDEVYDMEGETLKEAQDVADDQFIEFCQEHGLRRFSVPIELVRFYHTDDGIEIVERIKSWVEYEKVNMREEIYP